MTQSFLGGRRIVFLGTPAPAAAILDRLVTEGFDIAEVVTGTDARRGRGSARTGSPVKQVAERHGIVVRHDLESVSVAWEEAVGVVVAYGRIIPAELLSRTTMVNVHFSLLPRWRGAAPVERSILAGDPTTGVCIMEVVDELDAGGVYASAEIEIGRADRDELLASLTVLGADRLVEVLRGPASMAVPQVGEPTYAKKIRPEEGIIDWSNDAETIVRQVRALRAHTWIDGRRLLVLEAESARSNGAGSPGECDDSATVTCGAGSLRLITVQPEGRAALDALQWRRGVRGPVKLGPENS